MGLPERPQSEHDTNSSGWPDFLFDSSFPRQKSQYGDRFPFSFSSPFKTEPGDESCKHTMISLISVHSLSKYSKKKKNLYLVSQVSAWFQIRKYQFALEEGWEEHINENPVTENICSSFQTSARFFMTTSYPSARRTISTFNCLTTQRGLVYMFLLH